MSRIIVITSGKGGAGKTTITANLARALAGMGQKIAAMDVDFGLNNLDVILGVENKVVYDIGDVIEGRCRLKQALVPDPLYPNLLILPSCQMPKGSKLITDSIKSIAASLSEFSDYVLIDCPAGIEVGFHRAVSAAKEALVVITPHISSIRDADKVIALLGSYNLLSTEVVVNRARGDLMLSGETVNIDDIAQLIKLYPLGVIPDDDSLNTFAYSKKSEAALAFNILANNIHNGTQNIFDATFKYRGLMGKLRRNLKKLV